MAQHKWHKEIKCFIDGGEVERKNINGDEWYLIEDIGEFGIYYMEYRIKPQPKEPQYLYCFIQSGDDTVRTSLSGLPRYKNEMLIGKIKLEMEQ